MSWSPSKHGKRPSGNRALRAVIFFLHSHVRVWAQAIRAHHRKIALFPPVFLWVSHRRAAVAVLARHFFKSSSRAVLPPLLEGRRGCFVLYGARFVRLSPKRLKGKGMREFWKRRIFSSSSFFLFFFRGGSRHTTFESAKNLSSKKSRFLRRRRRRRRSTPNQRDGEDDAARERRRKRRARPRRRRKQQRWLLRRRRRRRLRRRRRRAT